MWNLHQKQEQGHECEGTQSCKNARKHQKHMSMLSIASFIRASSPFECLNYSTVLALCYSRQEYQLRALQYTVCIHCVYVHCTGHVSVYVCKITVLMCRQLKHSTNRNLLNVPGWSLA